MVKRYLRLLRPAAIPADDYRFYLVIHYGCLAGLLIHALFILLFLWIGVHSLAYFNVVSVFIYTLAFTANRRGYHNFAAIAGVSEVVVHTVFAVIVLGLGSGFQYYILAIVPFIFMNTRWQIPQKAILLGALYFVYSALLFFYRQNGAYITLDVLTQDVLNAWNILAIFLIFSVMAYYYGKATQLAEIELRQANKRWERLAAIDDLTQLLNRRHMVSRLESEVSRFKRNNKPFSLVLADIDDFKAINDLYGHDCGDFVLQKVSTLLRNCLRRQDLVARWGGEEFLILLPETGLHAGRLVAEKLRAKLGAKSLYYKGFKIDATMTYGVSLYTGGSIDRVITYADRALYVGKSQGKNCVVVAESPPLTSGPEAETRPGMLADFRGQVYH
jgi:diguanylate cyclase (GGDEF)-like protein